MFKLWNTLHRQFETFEPIQAGRVGLYTCGPTVYNPVTLGNWRAFIFDDVLSRALRFLGYDVMHIMNITDVGHLVGDRDQGEDKIAREASRRGQNAFEMTMEYERDFLQKLSLLNIRLPDRLPRATEHIAEQIALVQVLEAKGFTYRTRDGVYFDTSKLKGYGKLSSQRLWDKEAGARVEVNPEKHHPADFALWKFSPKNKKREMEWESPWGIGFPGWHIECSAMSVKYLGQPFDIHTGGIDHISVHHENEIAQSEAATAKPLAHYWLHNEFLLVDGKRMGKSEGNAFTMDDLATRGFDPLAFRYLCLNTHYRAKLNFTWEGLEGAKHTLDHAYALLRRLPADVIVAGRIKQEFLEAVEDDLHMPRALAVFWDVMHSQMSDKEKAAQTLKMDEIFGLGFAQIIGKEELVPELIRQLAEEREHARRRKGWDRADILRSMIEEKGWKVEDAPEGYTLVRR